MKNLLNYNNNDTSNDDIKIEADTSHLNLFSTSVEPIAYSVDGIPIETSTSTGKRKKKTKTKKLSDGTEIVLADQDSELEYTQSNAPYSRTYDETNNMLKASIYQIDGLQTEITQELKKIKESKALKKKYEYISEFASTISSLVSTKVTAIREMNNSITQGHNLEMKRMKDLKLTENEKDDDKHVMDMYNAFISTPMGSYNPLNAPSLAEMTTAGATNMVRTDMVSTGDYQYDNYLNGLSPTQHMMLLEDNPNIQTVIVYDQLTGNRWFDVQDISTGKSIPNTDKPDELLANDCIIDLNNMVARNSNLGISYPLILASGNNNIINEY